MKTIAKVIESMLTKDASAAVDRSDLGGCLARQLDLGRLRAAQQLDLGRLIRRDRQPSRSSPAFSARPKVGWVG